MQEIGCGNVQQFVAMCRKMLWPCAKQLWQCAKNCVMYKKDFLWPCTHAATNADAKQKTTTTSTVEAPGEATAQQHRRANSPNTPMRNRAWLANWAPAARPTLQANGKTENDDDFSKSGPQATAATMAQQSGMPKIPTITSDKCQSLAKKSSQLRSKFEN